MTVSQLVSQIHVPIKGAKPKPKDSKKKGASVKKGGLKQPKSPKQSKSSKLSKGQETGNGGAYMEIDHVFPGAPSGSRGIFIPCQGNGGQNSFQSDIFEVDLTLNDTDESDEDLPHEVPQKKLRLSPEKIVVQSIDSEIVLHSSIFLDRVEMGQAWKKVKLQEPP
ncbi:hypothetical protein DdX_22197 [Ditylenchus destructor]|uniref:Uncharacterized protein n=1 Tax=Ditylenchus destructor TaxID=166010 RepID=A0AAD4QR09_9BILA|nr:hypothetical protein DdX_22197 [Ditylenchus destructor]